MSIHVGSVYADVLPDASKFNERLAAQINPQAKALGEQLGRQLSEQISQGIRKGLGDWPTDNPGRGPAQRKGEESGGAFADAFKTRVKAALADLPDVKLGADASEAERKLAAIRAELADLADKRIGVDLSDAEAIAKLDELRARLDRLNRESSSVEIKTDTAKASADLAKFQMELDRINGETATANVKVDGQQGITSLWGSIAMLTPALIPVAGGAAAVGMALVSMAGVGVGAVGVLGIALASVTSAVKLLGQQQTQQAAADHAAGQAAAARAQAIVSAQRQEQSAAMALGDARRQAANSEISSAQAIATAKYGIVQANQKVEAAQYGIVQANQRVESAQYSLAQADQAEQNAITALTNAREAATRALQSAANSAVDARLAERQAVLDLETAQKAYAVAEANGTLQTQAGQQVALDLQKAQQHLVETQEAAANATIDNTKAQKAGVDGAPAVISAQQAVANAHHNVVSAQQGVIDAQHNVAVAQQGLVDAQHAQTVAVQNLANAEHQAADQRIQSNESIVRAEQGVAAASDAMAAAQRSAAGQTNSALAETNKQVAALDPQTRAFAQYLRSTWLPIWHEVQHAATGGLLPGLHDGMEALKPEIPVFTGIIGSLASTMGDLFREGGHALTDPFWTRFFAMIRTDGGPLLSDLFHTLGNIATGFAGMVTAFEPMTLKIGSGIDTLSGKFSAWGQNLATSQGFHDFTNYIQAEWPDIKATVENVATAAGHLIQGLSGLGGPELEILRTFSGILASLPVPVVTAMVTAFAGFKIGSTIAGPLNSLSGALGKISATEGAAGVIGKVAGALPGVGIALGVIAPLVPVFLDFLRGTPKIADEAAKSVQSIAAAIDATNGKIDESVRKSVAIQIQQLGLGDAASKWGLSMKDLVDAATGVPGAMERVTAAAKLTDKSYDSLIKTGGDANGMLNAAKAKADDEFNALVKLAGGVDGTIKKNQDLTTAVYGSVDAQKAMQGASEKLTDAVVKSGVIVSNRWDANTAVLEGATQKQIGALQGLGFEVIHLPNGKIVVTSDTGAARTALNQLIKDYSNRQIAIAAGNFGPAAARVTSGGGYAAGGWTGPGSKYTPAGIVHANEFVVPSERVDALGGPAGVGALVGMPGYAAGGPVAPFNMYKPMPAVLSAAAMKQAEAIIASLFPTGGVAGAPTSVSGNAALARSMAAQIGWTGAQWDAEYALGIRESGWRNTAQNPTSTAYGIAQFLDSTWATVGLRKTSDPATQILGMERYIGQRYGTPINAWAHETKFGWYDHGGEIPPGPSLVYNGTGDTELIAPKRTFEQVMSGATGGSAGPAGGPLLNIEQYNEARQSPDDIAEALNWKLRTR